MDSVAFSTPGLPIMHIIYMNFSANLVYILFFIALKPQSHQAYGQVTTYLRPKNGPIVETTYEWSHRSYDWSQRSWVIARGKSVAARSWSCSKPSHTGLSTRLRPTCDRKMLQSWANPRKNVRLAAEIVRLVAEVVGDRKGQISRNKVDGHVQNLIPAIPNRKRSHV